MKLFIWYEKKENSICLYLLRPIFLQNMGKMAQIIGHQQQILFVL